MKRMLPIGALFVLVSLPVFAGGYFMNDTGETVYGLRVVFSEPVTITSFGDVLNTITTQEESSLFTFSGGAVEPWGDHWIIWEPASASIVSSEWLGADWGQPEDAAAEHFDYEVTLEEIGTDVTVSRYIGRNCLPFEVRYAIENPEAVDGYHVAWDTDKYVDSDGNGNPQDDHDHEGSSVDLIYLENYNPTITLLIVDGKDNLVAQWENMARNDFEIGAAVSLDGQALADLAGTGSLGEVYWTQLHMEKMDLEYMTEYSATLVNAGAGTTNALHESAGKYVYELRDDSSAAGGVLGRVSAWVLDSRIGSKKAGLLMADLWNEKYDPSSGRMLDVSSSFSDAEAVMKLDWLVQQGLDEIVVMNLHPMVRTAPMPEIIEVGPIHRIGPADTAMVFAHIPEGHISWLTFDFAGMGSGGTSSGYWEDVENRGLDYYQEFFRQYRPLVLEEARQAEAMGLESISLGWGHPYLRQLPQIRAKDRTTGDWVAEQWIELIKAVKAEFSGEVGIGFIYAEEADDEIAAEADFIAMALQTFRDAWRFFGDPESQEELRSQYDTYVSYLVSAAYESFHKPIRFTFWAHSFEGAADGWPGSFENYVYSTWEQKFALGGYSEQILGGETLPERIPDFREQVRLLEAIMPVLALRDEVYFIVSQFEYWKLLSFEDFAPSNVVDYFNVVTGSLQGKPAFGAFRMWASMLSPNDRLLYRREIPLHGRRTFISSGDCPKQHANWAQLPFVYEIPDGWAPEVYWYAGRNRPLSESEHWGLPGHGIAAVGLSFHEQGLDIHWLGARADLRSNFNYQLWFRHPSDDVTLFVEISAKDVAVFLDSRIDGVWQRLDPDGVCYLIGDSEISAFLPDFTLPSGDTVQDLRGWRIEAFILYKVPGNEYYKVFEGLTYDESAK